MDRTVAAWRQTRPDHMVEVLVDGRWHLAWDMEFPHRTTTSGEMRVGEIVRFRTAPYLD